VGDERDVVGDEGGVDVAAALREWEMREMQVEMREV